MRKPTYAAAVIVAALCLLTGCATAPMPQTGASVAPGAEVPDGVDIAEWDDVYGSGVISVTPAFAYRNLDELAKASDLVVVGKVVEQHPFPDHDMITTLSVIEITEVLQGEVPYGPLRLQTIGTPVYLEQHSDVEGAGDPPSFNQGYVMFLKALPELTNAKGELVPVDNVWTATGLGHYAQHDDGTFHWDGDDPNGESGPTPQVTLDEIYRAVRGGA